MQVYAARIIVGKSEDELTVKSFVARLCAHALRYPLASRSFFDFCLELVVFFLSLMNRQVSRKTVQRERVCLLLPSKEKTKQTFSFIIIIIEKK